MTAHRPTRAVCTAACAAALLEVAFAYASDVDFTRAATAGGAGDALDPEAREQLEALGYLEPE